MIFVDTSAFYALMDADDDNHEHAEVSWSSWIDQPVLFASSNYVLLETVTLIQRRLGVVAARRFCEDLAPLFHMHWVDRDLHTAAVGALLTAGRCDLSLVDCTSFELMRRLGISNVFAFDRHFTERGFACVP